MGDSSVQIGGTNINGVQSGGFYQQGSNAQFRGNYNSDTSAVSSKNQYQQLSPDLILESKYQVAKIALLDELHKLSKEKQASIAASFTSFTASYKDLCEAKEGKTLFLSEARTAQLHTQGEDANQTIISTLSQSGRNVFQQWKNELNTNPRFESYMATVNEFNEITEDLKASSRKSNILLNPLEATVIKPLPPTLKDDLMRSTIRTK